jgi:hypothetical protein
MQLGFYRNQGFAVDTENQQQSKKKNTSEDWVQVVWLPFYRKDVDDGSSDAGIDSIVLSKPSLKILVPIMSFLM